MEKQRVGFGNSVVKQGNSLTVRIPKMASNALNLKEGDKIKVVISRPKGYFFSDRQIKKIIKECMKTKKLKSFGEEKIGVFISLMNLIINNRVTENIKEKGQEKRLTKQFGKKFVKEYKDFIKTLEKYPKITSLFKNP